METNAKKLALWKRDPLLFLCKGRLGLSNLQLTVGFVAIAALVELGLGWVVDHFYAGGGTRFTDPQFYRFALGYVILIAPLLVGSYAWHTTALARLLRSFDRTDVLQTISTTGIGKVKSYQDFCTQFQREIDTEKWAVVSVVAIMVFWLAEFLVAWPAEFQVSGGPAFWYDVKWYLVLRVLNLSVGLYALSMLILKQIQAIIYLNRLFQWFKIEVHPLHPDGAGGLGALGSFTTKASLIVVGLGGIALLYSLLVQSMGINPLSRFDVVGFWALYLLLTPISLLLPMLSAHRAMQGVKDEKLLEIADEFEYTLSDPSIMQDARASSIKETNEKLAELQTRHDLVMKTFPAWPISTRLFRNFSITASLPLVSGMISMVIDFAIK